MIGIPAEININDCNTCQYTDWHELKACAFTERTNISNVWTSPRPIQKNSRPPAGSSCGLTKAKRERRKNSKVKMDWNILFRNIMLPIGGIKL